jgi:hypothetical protein
MKFSSRFAPTQPLIACLGAALLLAACGGGGDKGGSSTPTEPPWMRGTLLASNRTAQFTADTLKLRLVAGGSVRDAALAVMTGDPVCGVDVNAIQYTTVGGLAEQTTGSGVVMVPTGSDARCTGARPVVLYAHGTNPAKAYNLAAMVTTSNDAYGEALMLAAFYAAQGYIVVAPNYVGYDVSTLGYHPFLVADQQSKDMLDALTAARKAFPALATPVVASAKLFITGYSQGGHVALATQRAMQQLGTAVTAVAPLSGPYALAAQTDEPFLGRVGIGATLFGPLIAISYQKVYKNIYGTPADLYEAKYVNGSETLLPGANAGTLASSGKLPQYALLNNTPPQAAGNPTLQALLNASTPPVTGTSQDKVYALGFAADHLFTNSYRLAVVQDALANPDGATPGSGGNLLPAAAPQQPLRLAAKLNDLRGFTPTSPVLLCGGNQDSTVPYGVNTLTMAQLWAGLPAGMLTVVDVDSRPASLSEPFRAEKLGFAVVKNAIIAEAQASGADPDVTVAVNYHAGVAPFCMSAARTFFQRF